MSRAHVGDVSSRPLSRRAWRIVLALVYTVALDVGGARAQSPAPTPTPSASVADERFSTKQRHLVLLWSALRRLTAAQERLARGDKVDWPRLTAWLASVAKLDREMRVREALLNVRADGPFAARLERACTALRGRAAELEPQAPAPLIPDDAFVEPEPVAPVPAQAQTAGQLRAKLKTTPARSVQDLFGASAGLKKTQLPKKGSR